MPVQDREVRINLSAKGQDCAISLHDDRTKESKSGVLSNLSRSGMFLKMNEKLKEGKTYSFHLRSHDGKNIRGRLHVKWNRPRPLGPYLPQGVGAHVDEFYGEAERQWFELIESNLSALTLADFISLNLVMVQKSQSVESVIMALKKTRETAAVVVDHKQKPVGLFSEREIIRNILEPQFLKKPVCDFMKEHPPLLDIHAEIEDAIRMLKLCECGYLAIIEEGKLVGVVTLQSVIPYWSETTYLKERRLRAELQSTIDVIAHDLRNPISIIQTCNSMLTSRIMTPEEYMGDGLCDVVKHNCDLMLSLVDDLISDGKGDVVGTDFMKKTVDLAELAESVTHQFQYHARRKKIRLEFIKSDMNIWALVNGRRIEQVLANLISNALKYSTEGDSVNVVIGKEGTQARLEVSDSGQGIPANELPHVFDKYCKISTTPTAGEPSTGLGLSIAKKMIEAHDGEIRVTSCEGQGSTFAIYLPLGGEGAPPLGQMIN